MSLVEDDPDFAPAPARCCDAPWAHSHDTDGVIAPPIADVTVPAPEARRRIEQRCTDPIGINCRACNPNMDRRKPAPEAERCAEPDDCVFELDKGDECVFCGRRLGQDFAPAPPPRCTRCGELLELPADSGMCDVCLLAEMRGKPAPPPSEMCEHGIFRSACAKCPTPPPSGELTREEFEAYVWHTDGIESDQAMLLTHDAALRAEVERETKWGAAEQGAHLSWKASAHAAEAELLAFKRETADENTCAVHPKTILRIGCNACAEDAEAECDRWKASAETWQTAYIETKVERDAVINERDALVKALQKIGQRHNRQGAEARAALDKAL